MTARHFHNVEPSGFHRGEYVGYREGAVYRIKRRESGGWVASRRQSGVNSPDAGAPFVFAKTLGEMSAKLGA